MPNYHRIKASILDPARNLRIHGFIQGLYRIFCLFVFVRGEIIPPIIIREDWRKAPELVKLMEEANQEVPDWLKEILTAFSLINRSLYLNSKLHHTTSSERTTTMN